MVFKNSGNELEIDTIDYWFLESAVEDIIGFSWIVPDETGDIGINRESLNISIHDMAKVMQRLFQDGNMLAINSADLNFLYFEQKEILNIDLLSEKGFVPSLKQIKSALKQQNLQGIYADEELYYFLSAKGGDLWEYFSHPEWKKHINYKIQATDIEISGVDLDIITKFLELYHLFSYDSQNIYHLLLDTQIWNEITPFQCVYWKSFSLGYKVSCQIRSEKVDRESIASNKKLLNQRKEANNWYRDMTQWHLNYNT
jgi:hypothetical protein